MNMDWLTVIVGVLITIIIGLPIAFLANWLWDKLKERKRRKRPYIFITTTPENGVLQFEGRVWENTAMGTAMKDIAKQVLGEPGTLTKEEPSKETSNSDVEKQA